jgi:hypothetical protein
MSVSVVMPAFNRAHLVARSIESALAQTYRDIEIIVVDDGSTDDTAAVVQRFGDQVRYVYQQNAGVGAARNTGMRHATGRYVAFLDSDDRWHDFKLSMQVALLEARPDVGLVFSEFAIEKPNGEIRQNGCARWMGRPATFPSMTPGMVRRPASADAASWPVDTLTYWAGPMYRQLLDELPILTSSTIVRRTALDPSMLYGEGIKLFEDWEFFARVASRHALAFIPTTTTFNYGHPDPGRVSACSALTRARCFVSLLDRVWGSDPDFVAAYGSVLRAAQSRACLALTRQAVLAREFGEAREALDRWRALGGGDGRRRAAVYSLCATLPAGDVLLKGLLRAHAVGQSVTGQSNGGYSPVHPAA